MSESRSQRRMAENEVIFREYNERVQQGFDKIKRIAKEDGQESLVSSDDGDRPLHFYCECADEKCHQRIIMTPSRYNTIHQQRNRFIVICGHDNPEIEKIVEENKDFCVVEKYMEPPKTASEMHKTDLDFS